MRTKKKIWIDLENTPHVLFFAPIIKKLKERGFRIAITARNYSQVYALADLFRLEHTRIGRHSGKNKMHKVFGLVTRALLLVIFAKKEKPQFAFNHGSRSQLLATKILRIPCLAALDYEHTQHLPFIYPSVIIMPQVLYTNYKRKDFKRIASYPGIKEDVYVQSYIPDNSVLSSLGIRNKSVVVTIRPPATEAHYHSPKSDELFKAVIDFISRKDHTCMIIVPRTKKQDAFIRKIWPDAIANGQIVIPDRILNGLDLIWFSDLVISGGGTMIREAAALNVPAYSFFQGKTGAVDQYLSNVGKLTLLKTIRDVNTKIYLMPRHRPNTPEHTESTALESIVETVNAMMNHNILHRSQGI